MAGAADKSLIHLFRAFPSSPLQSSQRKGFGGWEASVLLRGGWQFWWQCILVEKSLVSDDRTANCCGMVREGAQRGTTCGRVATAVSEGTWAGLLSSVIQLTPNSRVLQ